MLPVELKIQSHAYTLQGSPESPHPSCCQIRPPDGTASTDYCQICSYVGTQGPGEKRPLTAENCGEMEPSAGSTTLYIANRNLRLFSTHSLHDSASLDDSIQISMSSWTMQGCGHAVIGHYGQLRGKDSSVSNTQAVALQVVYILH